LIAKRPPASTNDNLILQDAMQLVAILHRAGEPDRRRWVTVDDAIAMATTGGAQAMREAELGRLVPGAKADLVLYGLSAPWWVPLNDPAQQFVFGERGGSVDTVIVDGRIVVEQGRALTIDEKTVLAAAKSILPNVRSRNAPVRAIAEAVTALE
jgi:cytosine/adenosine deaminase-related metal-dependent hydrolase